MTKKKLGLSLLTALCVVSMLATCFASGEALSDSLDFSPIITAFTDKITPTDIIAVIAMVAVAGMGFVLAWFGIRKVIKVLKGAIQRGRISI